MAAKTLPQAPLSDKPIDTALAVRANLVDELSLSNPDPLGLVRYVFGANDDSLSSFHLKWLGEESTFRDELVTLLRAMGEDALRGRQDGKVNFYKRQIRALLQEMSSAKAKVFLVEWVRACRASDDPALKEEFTKAVRPGRKAASPKLAALRASDEDGPCEPFFRSPEEARSIRCQQTTAERYWLLRRYEVLGCIVCGENDEPYASNGMCNRHYVRTCTEKATILRGAVPTRNGDYLYPEKDAVGIDINQIYFQLYGCLKCEEKNRTYGARGLCTSCRGLIRRRREAIGEGRKIRKQRGRFGVPSPVSGDTEFLRAG